MIRCPNCGTSNFDENKFCGECGFELPELKNYCPSCNKTYMMGEKFCTACGTKLVNKEFHELNAEKQQRRNELYRTLSDEALLKWAKDNNYVYTSKNHFINDIIELDDFTIEYYVNKIKDYEELINNGRKLEVYNRLYDELDDEEIELLKSYHVDWFIEKRAEVLIEYLKVYDELRIKEIIHNEKEKQRMRNEKQETKHSKNPLKTRMDKVIHELKNTKSLKQAAINSNEKYDTLLKWYSKGKRGEPNFVEFYNDVSSFYPNGIEE